MSARTRLIGVGGDGFIGFEVQVALDRKSEFAARGAKFDEAHVAELRLIESEIAKAECVSVAEAAGVFGVAEMKADAASRLGTMRQLDPGVGGGRREFTSASADGVHSGIFRVEAI